MTTRAGEKQAANKPKKLLKNGLDPSVGKKTQFKPGESGNPAGLPKGTKHISTWVQELLNDPDFVATIQVGLQLKEYKGAPLKAMIEAQIRLAINGDSKAFDALRKAGWGSSIDLTSGGEPITGNPFAALSEEELRKLAKG